MLPYPRIPGAMTDRDVDVLQLKRPPINQFIDEGKKSIDETYARNVAERQAKLATPAYQPSLGEFQAMNAPSASPWADAHTAAAAEIVPPGGRSSAVRGINLFGGGTHLDTPLLNMDRNAIPGETWTAYRQMTKAADQKLYLALAGRASVPHTLDEARQFVQSLGFDDRVGEHVERAMTKYLQNANPELYRQMIGERAAQSANDRSYVQWARQNNPDPAYARMTPEQILAMRTPEEQQRFEGDPDAEVYSVDPGTGKAMPRAPQKLTPRQVAEQEFKLARERAALSEGQLVAKNIKGHWQAVSVEDLQAEQQAKTDALNEKRLTRLNAQHAIISNRIEKRRESKAYDKWKTDPNARDMKMLTDIENEIAKIHGLPPEDHEPTQVSDEIVNKLTAALALPDLNPTERQAIQDKLNSLKSNVALPSVNLPKVGEVRKGYQYQGGDPASPKSWAPTQSTPTVEDLPVLTPEEAAKVPPGTRFKGIDGQIRVRQAEPTAVNPQTGQEMVYRNGAWVPL